MIQKLYESESCVLIHKPATDPIQADQTGSTSLLEMAEKAMETSLFVVHRLDRPVSGVVLFAKNKAAASFYSEQFATQKVEKTYIAAVRTVPLVEHDQLIHFLQKNKNGKAKVVEKEHPKAKRAELRYTVIGKSTNYCFLEIQLLTGRHHQIRAQLAAIGCTIKGDVRYGDRRSNRDRSIHLHARALVFEEKETGERVTIKADFPEHDAVWKACADLSTVA